MNKRLRIFISEFGFFLTIALYAVLGELTIHILWRILPDLWKIIGTGCSMLLLAATAIAIGAYFRRNVKEAKEQNDNHHQ